jgi:hypothetical protein
MASNGKQEKGDKGEAQQFTPFLTFLQLLYVIVISLSMAYFANLGGSLVKTDASWFLLLENPEDFANLHSITKFLANPLTIFFFFLFFFAIDWLVGQFVWQINIRKYWLGAGRNYKKVVSAFLVQIIAVVSLGLSLTLGIFEHPSCPQFSPYLWFAIYCLLTVIWSIIMISGKKFDELNAISAELQGKIVEQAAKEVKKKVEKGADTISKEDLRKILGISVRALIKANLTTMIFFVNTFVVTPAIAFILIFRVVPGILVSPIVLYMLICFLILQYLINGFQAYRGFVAFERILKVELS